MSKSNCYGAMLWAFSTLLVSMGCSDDSNDFKDVDGQVPSVSLTTTHVQTEAGREFTIKGTVEDKDGIRSIRLQNSDLELDKTIDLVTLYEELLYTYELSYKFKTPKTLTGDSFSLLITVTDVGGRTVESTVLVTMDGDFTIPVFTAVPDAAITVLIKENTKLNLRFTVEDDKALDYVEVDIPELKFNRKVEVTGKTLSFSEFIDLPSEAATYNLTITAVDKFQLETVKKSVITVSDMPDFPKMYLSDIKEVSQLNSDLFGIPMLIERTEAYTYKARYYSEAAGTEIYFIPQKTDFSPICFGINPDDKTLLTDEPELSLPIILENIGYYEIDFNVKTGEYSVIPYVLTDEPVKIGSDVYLDSSRPGEGTMKLQLCLAGTGFPDYESWSTSNGVPLTLSSTNPYLFSAEVRLVAGETVEFTISARHDWGWWPEPYWRFSGDENTAWDKNVKNGGSNPKITVTTSGMYMFKFDTHLLRSKLYPIN